MMKSSSDKSEPQVLPSLIPGKLSSVCSRPSHPSPNALSALKRTKAYSNLANIRPTLKDKPSGLKAGWRGAAKQPVLHRQVSKTYARSSPSSSSTLLSSVGISRSPPPELELDHTSSMLAVSPPPIFSKLSSPPSFHGNVVPLVDAKAEMSQGHSNHLLVQHFYNCHLIRNSLHSSLLSCLAGTRRQNGNQG